MVKIQFMTLIVALMFVVSCGEDKKADPAPAPVPNSGSGEPKPELITQGKCTVSSSRCDLSIKGTYTDAFNTTHTVGVSSWVSSHATFGSSTYNHIIVDNTEKRIIAQNSLSNGYAPNKYSAFDWTQAGGILYYCQIAYDKATQAEAEAIAKADASNPTVSGCGGFPWSALN